jgi:penicillin amidase
LTVRQSRHGPVISDIMGFSGKILAVSMANLQPGDTAATGLLALNRARTVAEAGAAAPVIASPVQNLLVADKQTIGQFTIGRIPIRRAGDGSAPVPGDGSHDWIGWASGDALPHDVSPASGRLLNANERIAPPDFPVFLGRDWYSDWRARRIAALLDAMPKPTLADFARMQTDVRSTFAEQVLPVLRASEPGKALFAGWNGDMTMDAPQPLAFNRWLREFHRLVFQRAGLEPNYGGPMADFVGFILTPAGAHWCGGDCAPLVREALDTVAAEKGLWGDAHPAIFAHPMLRGIPVLGGLTTLSIPSPGDDTTLDRGSPNARMESVHGASYRGVYDLSDLDRSLFMVAPGQSGNPLRAHAKDMLRRWRDGATLTLGREPAAVMERIELIP